MHLCKQYINQPPVGVTQLFVYSLCSRSFHALSSDTQLVYHFLLGLYKSKLIILNLNIQEVSYKIHYSFCAVPQCEEGEDYSICGPAQEGTCIDPMPVMQAGTCTPGCSCMEGFVRHEGKCIKFTDCPGMHN